MSAVTHGNPASAMRRAAASVPRAASVAGMIGLHGPKRTPEFAGEPRISASGIRTIGGSSGLWPVGQKNQQFRSLLQCNKIDFRRRKTMFRAHGPIRNSTVRPPRNSGCCFGWLGSGRSRFEVSCRFHSSACPTKFSPQFKLPVTPSPPRSRNRQFPTCWRAATCSASRRPAPARRQPSRCRC